MAPGNPSLTKILFGFLMGTFIVSMLFGSYVDFAGKNGLQIQEPFNSSFQKIADSYEDFGDLSGQSSDQGLVKNVFNAGKVAVTGTMNVFVVGLEAIASFFGMIPLIGNVLEAVSEAFPFFQPLIGAGGLISILFILYIAMRYIQSASNKYETP